MKELDIYRLSLKGLRFGTNKFQYELGPTFFQVFEQNLIHEAFISIELEVDKRDEMMVIDIRHHGYMITPCDRCLESIRLPLEGQRQLLVKFDQTESEDDPDVLFIRADSDFFNPAPYMYEFIVLSLPMVRTYDCKRDKQAPCSEEVLRHLAPKSTKADSPVWDELKKLKLK